MNDMLETVAEFSRRVENYLKAPISSVISDYDDMFARSVPFDEAFAHYMHVGRSAIAIIVSAMVITGKTTFQTVLDLPCGGGRVTRHLRVFLPEADLFVGDMDQNKRRFVAGTFSVLTFDAPINFDGMPLRQFDLIFVGSLVTHFDERLFRRSLNWFISALMPDGILVLTTHGRRHNYLERAKHHLVEPARWEAVDRNYERSGFGFTPYSHSADYGVSLTAPSWIMRLVETDPSIRIVSFQEGGWANHQDVLVLQKNKD
jgi:SAM-dependent methyltransferase